MKTRLTVLSENSVELPKNAIGEHGFSVFIDRDDATLFDTGQGLVLMHNMKVLSKDPEAIQRVILSHGHYDHAGGLAALLEARKQRTPVSVHPDAFGERIAYLESPGGHRQIPIGIPRKKEEYEGLGAQFISTEGHEEIAPGIHSFSSIPRPEGWKGFDSRLKVKRDGAIVDDPFTDDLSLAIDTGSGPVVLLGCAHAGLVEILEDISGKTGWRELHAVIGGAHLARAPSEYVERAVQLMKSMKVKVVATSHCTGFKAAVAFANAFGDSFRPAGVGSVFEF
jgi:7,8-dihydropterin-6-yl-methyl-4-(beta-D-ribofuranosyl)aminobenzene 5'-phosphate synthase